MPYKMKRNCNLELCLQPSSATSLSSEEFSRSQPQNMEDSSERNLEGKKQQQLTIFYNGRVCVCDVTELQARSILMVASREMEERMKSPTGSEQASPVLQSQLYSNPTGLSMKRSLQRFLQKRQRRKLETSPYRSTAGTDISQKIKGS